MRDNGGFVFCLGREGGMVDRGWAPKPLPENYYLFFFKSKLCIDLMSFKIRMP